MNPIYHSDPPDHQRLILRRERVQRERFSANEQDMISLLPGPVRLRPEVVRAFSEPILYHRSSEFLELYEQVRTRLSACVGGVPVGLFVGSGTLANEAVAATLAADAARRNGLMLVSGEFGQRLLRQAERWQLQPHVIRWEWGQAWNLEQVEQQLRSMPPGGWIWGVHHETSTGVLNDLPGLVNLAKKYQQRVCIDAVSSLGTVDIDLRDVYLTSGTSGKAIGSYPGIAFVFADPRQLTHLNTDSIPGYLDVLTTITTEGPRFTVPSSLIRSLDVALDAFSSAETRARRYDQILHLGRFLHRKLCKIGLTPITPEAIANPAIITFAPPSEMTSAEFIELCEQWGYQIAGQSGYLAERRLVQISLMGDIHANDLELLLEHWEQLTEDLRSGVTIAS